jgi:hypothetical protein
MRTLLVALLAFGLALFGGLFALVMPWPCPVNRAAYERVKEGMPLEEVHAILGGRPGDTALSHQDSRPITLAARFLARLSWVRFGRGTKGLSSLLIGRSPESRYFSSPTTR